MDSTTTTSTTTTTLEKRAAGGCARVGEKRIRAPRFGLFVVAFVMLGAAACSSPQRSSRATAQGSNSPPSAAPSVTDNARPDPYDDRSRWLCRPDLARDACDADLTATELRSDGSMLAETHAATNRPRSVDCFYVYPTVDMSIVPANHQDFADTAPMARATVSQAARFRDVCELYVPLYHQITIGTYALSRADRELYLRTAYGDIAEAFRHYLASVPTTRRFVLMGHSQGAEMIVRLVREFVDHDATLRARMLLALAIGAEVETPRGAAAGGTFENVPLCTRRDERGCVIAYRSYRDGDAVIPGMWAPSAGHVSGCVNPAGIGSDDAARFARTYLPTEGRDRARIIRARGVTTPFLLVRDAYSGRCVEGRDGYRYLAISPATAPSDARHDVIPWRHEWLGTALGLHLLDYQFPQGDLIDHVGRLAAAEP